MNMLFVGKNPNYTILVVIRTYKIKFITHKNYGYKQRLLLASLKLIPDIISQVHFIQRFRKPVHFII